MVVYPSCRHRVASLSPPRQVPAPIGTIKPEASSEPPIAGGFRAAVGSPIAYSSRCNAAGLGFVMGMTEAQHEDPYAWTWEPAVGILAAVSLFAVLAVQAGRSLTLAAVGAGWHWPPSAALVTSSWGILTGDLHAGLGTVGDGGLVEVAWVIAGALFIAGLFAFALLALRVTAGRRFKGMASSGQAEHLLGLGRLRKHRAVIRPDLYRTGDRP